MSVQENADKKDVTCKNSTRIEYDHRVGDQVLLKNKADIKMQKQLIGPYKIIQIWTNRAVTLRVGSVTKRINTRQIKPYKQEGDKRRHHSHSTIIRNAYTYTYKYKCIQLTQKTERVFIMK